MVHVTTLFFCFVFLAGPKYALAGNTTNTTNATTLPPSAPIVNPTVLPTPYGHFNLSDKAGKICLLLDLQSVVHVDYQLKDKSATETVSYSVPTNAMSTGSCGAQEDVSKLNLTWPWSNKWVTLVLSMEFTKSSEAWSSSKVAFHATSVNGPLVTNGTLETLTAVGSGTDPMHLKAKAKHSYKCEKTKKVQLGSSVSVSFLKIRVQPFGGEFGQEDVCSTSNEGGEAGAVQDTIVPIAVGCALLGMIVILIITYFVGRAKRTGYETM